MAHLGEDALVWVFSSSLWAEARPGAGVQVFGSKPRAHLTGPRWLGGWCFTWLSQSWWVLQALTCGLDPPSTSDSVQWGWAEGGAAARSSQTGGAARAGVSKSQAPGEEG